MFKQKVSHVNGRMPHVAGDGEKVETLLNIDAALEDFRILGGRLVESFDVKSTRLASTTKSAIADTVIIEDFTGSPTLIAII